MIDLPKAYESKQVEDRIYKSWKEGGYFTPKIDHARQPFTIIMPPPNVTGELHIGHALTATLEDIMIRWHRMLGDPTLWLPGVDHAGIATQVVVEKELARQGLDRHQIGREEFLKHVWAWVKKSRSAITHQHERLGASCDWSRERFTLDDGPVKAVKTTFVNLYNKGLIYRGERIINWCPRCRTALSDLEVQNKDIASNLWHMRYPFEDGSGYITVATTRPETYLGDAAVAVNPEDERYTNLIGKKVILPFINRAIPVIGDEAIDKEFGTGMVKVTPAHDPVDFEISQRHHLPIIHILNPDATLNDNAGPYIGLDRFEARKRVVEDFTKAGLMEKIEPYSHAVPHCFRCSTIIEPEVSKQWFVRIAPLAEPAATAVRDGRIKILPERFTRIYLNWMDNIRDWCISRQLWWGHRIPVWYCLSCGEMIVSTETPTACPKCGGTRLEQDPDVLDTWFSSGLWPHSTLGWPDQTEDLRYFYPTSVMETGYDILFFWVARMIMLGIENTGDAPFHTVYLHGLIRDENGEKMSKMKGNVLNPLTAINQYGCDALRFALTTGTAPGNDINMGAHRMEAGRNFANKLWNAGRFVLKALEAEPASKDIFTDISKYLTETEDRWIVSRLNRLVGEVDSLLKDFQFGEAEKQIHDFLWGEYCDWYIEISKQRLGKAGSPLPVLAYVLEALLRLLHPFMPFITEELWQNMKERLPQGTLEAPALIVARYPVADGKVLDDRAEQVMEAVMEIIRSIRNTRAEYKVDTGRWVESFIYADSLLEDIQARSDIIEMLARTRPLNILPRTSRPAKNEKALVAVLRYAEVIVPLAGMIDLNAEKARLSKEMDGLQNEIVRLTQRLEDGQFIGKAPSTVVEKEKARLEEYKSKFARMQAELQQLG